MKNVIDLFIAKDRTAVFWFTMACASIFCSAIYVHKVVSDVTLKPQYVIMDGNGIYYLAPSIEFENATDIHLAQTRLALETIYNRGPRNLDFEPRVRKLFYKDGITKVNEDFNKDAKKFVEEDRHQTIEITEVSVAKVDPRGVAITRGRGILTRTSTFKGKTTVAKLKVNGLFYWRLNPKMADNGLFPTVCYRVELADPKLEESEG